MDQAFIDMVEASQPPRGSEIWWTLSDVLLQDLIILVLNYARLTLVSDNDQCGYIDEVKEGLWIRFDSWSGLGFRSEMWYRQGLLEGPFIEYYTDGTKKAEGHHIEGHRTGSWIFRSAFRLITARVIEYLLNDV